MKCTERRECKHIANILIKSSDDKNELRHWGVKGMKWGKTDPKKEEIRNGNSSNQNEAVMKLKKDLEKQGPAVTKSRNVTDAGPMDKSKVKSLEEFQKSNQPLPEKVFKKLEKLFPQVFSETNTYTTYSDLAKKDKIQGPQKPKKSLLGETVTSSTTYSDLAKKKPVQGPTKPKKKTLAERFPSIFSETTTFDSSDKKKKK